MQHKKEIQKMSTKTMDVNTAAGFAGFDPTSVTKDALKTMKSSFDMSFTYVTKIQDLSEKMLRETAELGKVMQTDSTKVIEQCIENAKKGRIEQKKVVDDYFKKAEELY